MNVPHELARLLATGKATQLRLPVGRPQRLADGRTVPQHAQYKTGETYAAHAVRIIEFDGYEPTRDRDPDPVAHLRVTAVRRTTLGDRTVIDAKLEGYPTATWQDDMRDVWVRHYGDDNDDRPVWVLSVHPDHDLPQLLAWNGRPMGHLDPADHER